VDNLNLERVTDLERFMRAYLIVTGALFGLITLAHLLRMLDEWPHLATDPSYLLLTLAAAALCFWAFRLVRRSKRREP
jgi:protein-S-isoprenylcysteine O-methyltransferase Ste14